MELVSNETLPNISDGSKTAWFTWKGKKWCKKSTFQ